MRAEDVRLIAEKAIQRGAGIFGYDLRRKSIAKTIPVDVLGLAIRDLMERHKRDLTFVQIGAHDGLSYDPIARYVREYGWRGVLVEPQPLLFKKLVSNYEGVDGLVFENAAISSQDGVLRLYYFSDAKPDEHATMLASSKQHYLSYNGDGETGKIEYMDVPAMTPSSLLRKHDIRQLDLLQVDTEGHDYTILSAFDLEALRPSIIHFENSFMDSKQKAALLQRLTSLGYSTLDIGIDTLAVLAPEDKHFEARMELSKLP